MKLKILLSEIKFSFSILQITMKKETIKKQHGKLDIYRPVIEIRQDDRLSPEQEIEKYLDCEVLSIVAKNHSCLTIRISNKDDDYK